MNSRRLRAKRTQRALVTGATGFIGSHLVKHLLVNGWQVGALGRKASLASVPAGVERFTHTGATAKVMEAVKTFKPDVVFHLASLFVADHKPEQVEEIVTSNVLLGTQLLEAMKAAGCTAMVNAGTAWQNLRTKAPFDGPEYRPVNLYAATKQAFEDIAAYYVETGGLRLVTLRMYDTYGPHDRRRKLVKVLLEAAAAGTRLKMSTGEHLMDYVHVDDVCRALVHAGGLAVTMTAPGAEVYAVSGGDRRTLREVVGAVEQATGNKLRVEFGAQPYRTREVMHPWEGPALPGWKPQVTLVEGLRTLAPKRAKIQ